MSNIITEYVGGSEPKDDIKAQWWLSQTDQDLAQSMMGVVNRIETMQSWRQLQNIRFARLYANYELLGFYGTLFSRTAQMPLNRNRLSLNVVRAVIDTAASKIAKVRPRPLVLTSKGNWTQQERAQKLSRYIEGIFEREDVYQKGQQSFVDAAAMGTGPLKIYTDYANKKICFDRVLTDEIIVDDADGMYSQPRSIYQRKYMDRDVLVALYPKHEQAIRAAKTGIVGDSSTMTSANLIKVVEGWHLRSGNSASDGRHAIVIDGATLFDEDWKKDFFPFAFYRWAPRLVGFYGSGIAEEIVGIQLEINKMLRTIQEAQHITTVPRVWVEESSQVNTNNLSNEIGGIGKYRGTPPIFSTPNAMPPEYYNHLMFLYQKAFEITGVSMLSATSQKPSGLDAAVALREYQDIESERFQLNSQRYERFYIDAAKIAINLSRDLYEHMKDKGESLAVNVKGGKFLETIRWEDVDMDDDKFVMQVYPTSLLPTTPQGRLQKVTELVNGGYIDQEVGLKLLDMPDVESFMTLKTASYDIIQKLIEQMLNEGVYQTPEAYMNLQMAKPLVQFAYLRAKIDGAPESRLELLRQFLSDCEALTQQAQPPQEQAMAPQEAMIDPGAMPVDPTQMPPQGVPIA